MSPSYLAKDYLSNNKIFQKYYKIYLRLAGPEGPKAQSNKTGKRGVIFAQIFRRGLTLKNFFLPF